VSIATDQHPGVQPDRVAPDGADAADEVVRVGPVGRTVRLLVVAAVAVLLVLGSWKADDDAFPVGPFVMFAFTTPPDGEVVSAAVEAVDVTGTRVPVSLEPEDVGIRRAEVEGEIPRVIAHPELLGALARAHARLHPGAPAWQQVDLVQHRIRLHDGHARGETTVVLATWRRPA
jgi:hypothetical protein